MRSFCACRAQKHYKDSEDVSPFTLSGFACAKAAHKHVGEIDLRYTITIFAFIIYLSIAFWCAPVVYLYFSSHVTFEKLGFDPPHVT